MKKLALVLAVIISLSVIPSFASAVQLPLRVVVDGKKLTFPDAQPFVDSNGRTQTPAKFIGEALGATVTWDRQAKKAVFVSGGKKLILYIGKKDYELNGQKKQMDTAAIIEESRTFVPARYVAEAFGAAVTWDSDIRTVYINTDTPKTDTGSSKKTEVIAGFTVPKDRDLGVFVPSDASVEIQLMVDLLTPNVEKQITDMADILSQKCNKETVEQVVTYIKQKKVRRDHLAEKFIFDNKSQRCIWIKESQEADINICYLTSKDSKPYKN